ncbi:hypothetical protein [Actinacidiphila paucisporea]|nr:hypothetical protein [Actinacidiphila paucisporea]
MRYCTGCGLQIPPDVEAALVGVIEQGSGPGIAQYRHPACVRRPTASQQGPVPTGIRRAP